MKKVFSDGGYIEFQRSRKPYHVYISIAVRKENNPLELIINSAELSIEDLTNSVKSVTGPLQLETSEEE